MEDSVNTEEIVERIIKRFSEDKEAQNKVCTVVYGPAFRISIEQPKVDFSKDKLSLVLSATKVLNVNDSDIVKEEMVLHTIPLDRPWFSTGIDEAYSHFVKFITREELFHLRMEYEGWEKEDHRNRMELMLEFYRTLAFFIKAGPGEFSRSPAVTKGILDACQVFWIRFYAMFEDDDFDLDEVNTFRNLVDGELWDNRNKVRLSFKNWEKYTVFANTVFFGVTFDVIYPDEVTEDYIGSEEEKEKYSVLLEKIAIMEALLNVLSNK